MNSVNIIGRIASKKIEKGYTKDNVMYISFRIAYNENGKEASFFNVVGFGNYEKIYDELFSGQNIALTGRLRQRYYQNKEGQNKEIIEIVIGKLTILEWKNKKDDKINVEKNIEVESEIKYENHSKKRIDNIENINNEDHKFETEEQNKWSNQFEELMNEKELMKDIEAFEI